LDRGVKEKNMALILDGTTGIGIDSGTQPLDPASLNAVIQALIPTGTKMLFQQTAAPTGWTKDTTHDNKALRVVSGTAGSGGSVAFSTAFASQAVSGSIANTTATGTVGNTTLTTAQLPTHRHQVRGDFRADSVGIRFGSNGSTNSSNVNPASAIENTNTYTGLLFGWDTGSGNAHNHSFTGTAHNHSFTGTAINLAVSYVDLIIATKD
jgi:hypothetical protein